MAPLVGQLWMRNLLCEGAWPGCHGTGIEYPPFGVVGFRPSLGIGRQPLPLPSTSTSTSTSTSAFQGWPMWSPPLGPVQLARPSATVNSRPGHCSRLPLLLGSTFRVKGTFSAPSSLLRITFFFPQWWRCFLCLSFYWKSFLTSLLLLFQISVFECSWRVCELLKHLV